MKRIMLFMIVVSLVSCDAATMQKVLETAGKSATTLSNADISSGLKQALDIGVRNGVDYLSKKDGYYNSAYKILLPKEAQEVVSKLKVIPGMDNVEREIIKKLNRAAEDAVVKAKPIFVNAIKQMTFNDVRNILMGKDNAATQYLHRTTNSQLYNEFNPIIVSSLNKFGALDYWSDAVNAYNKIPFVENMNPKLDDYVTQRALDGLFGMVAKKELDIRNNIRSRTTDLLRRVFALQD